MKRARSLDLVALLYDERGATLAEYGILIVLIAVATVAIIKTLGPQFSQLFAPIVPYL